ncbi:MAG TPA: hypothetical protein VJN43_21930 [Bryobacteraceae bacterium]|nr:hypothetical protein [Bryobacteraceae bacterium]
MLALDYSRRQATACACALFLANAYVVHELFSVEYTPFMGSIGGAYVSLAQQLAAHWDLRWWPLWYAGIPYQNTYPPLLHWITGLTARFAHVSAAHSYNFITAFFYCLGPVTLFWMTLRLSRAMWPSFAGALLYSLFSPSALLVTAVRNDVGGVFQPRRLQALIEYGEGPHVASMTLLPVAIVLLDMALARRRPGFYLASALALAAVVLTNWLGAFALASAVLAYICSKRSVDVRRTLVACLGLAIFAYAIAAPWIPPSTLAAIRTNAQRIGGPYQITTAHLKYAAVILIAIALLWWWFERRKVSAHMRFFVTFAFLMCAITLASAWWQIFLMPQPDRYHLEMEMALCPLAVFAAAPLAAQLRRNWRLAVIVCFALFCFLQFKPYRRDARNWTRSIDIQKTSEHKVAEWMGRNMNGRRVFVPGSEYFWLNAFTDTPQLEGGFDQGVINPLLPALHYEIYTGAGTANEGELAVLWLRAFGVHAAAVCGPNSTEVYKPYRNWKKFEGLLPVLWRDGDDVIYRVLPNSVSPAHVLRPEDRMTRQPNSVLDMDFVRAYVAALENPAAPPVEMTWLNRHHAVLAANLQRSQSLLVQVTYHPGWRARVNGAPRRVTRDPIGLMLIEPECDGHCTVDLEYGDDAEMLAAHMASWTALAGGLAWIIFAAVRVRYWKHGSVAEHG